ncbi:hypothetical protein L228DRAFT_219531 [Xylona heveae TC161]|uniref:Uncharacterized protein n=1 Tax=Xylona heveae (strain CBS 132557 / TC161) TaxID=1328760 RepID=A0A165HBY4_XYLHT|nr:hypothetical protein L228DRAFT_219531 [Xylona heveae TC161]KZF23275.1 hypothetical protein L228DRAFT_219531 [Xylona heveae TC161]
MHRLSAIAHVSYIALRLFLLRFEQLYLFLMVVFFELSVYSILIGMLKISQNRQLSL